MKNKWMKAVETQYIASLLLVLAMAMYGCPAVGDGNGGKRVLNEDEKKLVGTWTNNGKQLHFRKEGGKWVQNAGGEQGYGAGYLFNSDGTYIYMIGLSDIVGQYTGSGIYYGNFSTDGDKLILSKIYYDYISKSGDKNTYGAKRDDILYYFRFGPDKYNTHEPGIYLQPEDMSLRESFYLALK